MNVDAQGGHEKALDPLDLSELEFQVVVSPLKQCLELNLGLLQEQ